MKKITLKEIAQFFDVSKFQRFPRPSIDSHEISRELKLRSKTTLRNINIGPKGSLKVYCQKKTQNHLGRVPNIISIIFFSSVFRIEKVANETCYILLKLHQFDESYEKRCNFGISRGGYVDV